MLFIPLPPHKLFSCAYLKWLLKRIFNWTVLDILLQLTSSRSTVLCLGTLISECLCWRCPAPICVRAALSTQLQLQHCERVQVGGGTKVIGEGFHPLPLPVRSKQPFPKESWNQNQKVVLDRATNTECSNILQCHWISSHNPPHSILLAKFT